MPPLAHHRPCQRSPYHPLQPARRHQNHCYLPNVTKQCSNINSPLANEPHQPKLTQYKESAEQAQLDLALLWQI